MWIIARNTQSIVQNVCIKNNKHKISEVEIMQDDEVLSQRLLEVDSKAREELNKILVALNQASAKADKEEFQKHYDILLSYLVYKLLNIEPN